MFFDQISKLSKKVLSPQAEKTLKNFLLGTKAAFKSFHAPRISGPYAKRTIIYSWCCFNQQDVRRKRWGKRKSKQWGKTYAKLFRDAMLFKKLKPYIFCYEYDFEGFYWGPKCDFPSPHYEIWVFPPRFYKESWGKFCFIKTTKGEYYGPDPRRMEKKVAYDMNPGGPEIYLTGLYCIDVEALFKYGKAAKWKGLRCPKIVDPCTGGKDYIWAWECLESKLAFEECMQGKNYYVFEKAYLQAIRLSLPAYIASWRRLAALRGTRLPWNNLYYQQYVWFVSEFK